jgi:hypothetical protein
MMQRSESDMLAKMPIKVTLGTQSYEIPILTILPSRQWRIKLNEAMGQIVHGFTAMASESTSEGVAQGLTSALLRFPEKVAELLFAYAGESLPQEEILTNATEEQMATAFSAVMQVAYPFLPQLTTVMKTMRTVPSSATAKSMN